MTQRSTSRLTSVSRNRFVESPPPSPPLPSHSFRLDQFRRRSKHLEKLPSSNLSPIVEQRRRLASFKGIADRAKEPTVSRGSNSNEIERIQEVRKSRKSINGSRITQQQQSQCRLGEASSSGFPTFSVYNSFAELEYSCRTMARVSSRESRETPRSFPVI